MNHNNENVDEIKQMKWEAIKNNDSFSYELIQLYEHIGNNVAVLIKAIKYMCDRYRKKIDIPEKERDLLK